MIALIPPVQGIRATLACTGVSRVVVQRNGAFHTLEVRRPPQTLTLTTPHNATGEFELQHDPELLLPFEGMSMDMAWEFRLPRPSNPFDFASLADVRLTFDCTALVRFDYGPQDIRTIDRDVQEDRPFSFRHEFADAWYDLNNPAESADLITTSFAVRRSDFPPNLDDIRIQQLLLYFSREDGATFEVPVRYLRFVEARTGEDRQAGAAQAPDLPTRSGAISTRRGHAASWRIAFLDDREPVGQWTLAMPNTVEVREWFKSEQIKDILFVVSFRGTTPEMAGLTPSATASRVGPPEPSRWRPPKRQQDSPGNIHRN